MRDNHDDGWEDWDYWAAVADKALHEQKSQDDWLAWVRFRAKLFAPLD